MGENSAAWPAEFFQFCFSLDKERVKSLKTAMIEARATKRTQIYCNFVTFCLPKFKGKKFKYTLAVAGLAALSDKH